MSDPPEFFVTWESNIPGHGNTLVEIRHKTIPVRQRPFDLYHVPLPFVAIFLAKFDRHRFEQTEGNIHWLEVLRFDIRNVTAQGADGGG